MTTWSVEETFKFIELYRNEPCIWNPKEKCHKDKNKVNDSWKRIADEIVIPVVELKNKKETLMTAFRSHLKRKKASFRSGAGAEEIYIPIWIFYDAMEGFLKDVYECKSIVNTEEVVLYVKDDSSEQSSGNCTDDPGPSQKDIIELNKMPRKRRAVNSPEFEEVTSKMNSAFDTLNEVLMKKKSEDDEYTLYGRLLGVQLRQFHALQRADIMCEIDGIRKNRQSMYARQNPTPSSSTNIPNSETAYTPSILNEKSGNVEQQKTFYIASVPQDILSAACESAEINEPVYVLPHNYIL